MLTTTMAQQAASAIDNHIRYHGGAYSSWYCGISANPNDRLIKGHNATTQANAAWHWDAGSETEARNIEEHFHGKGCKGSGGGGDHDTRYVYVYRISTSTRE